MVSVGCVARRCLVRAPKISRRNFQKPLLVRHGGTIQIAGSRMGPIGFLGGKWDSVWFEFWMTTGIPDPRFKCAETVAGGC